MGIKLTVIQTSNAERLLFLNNSIVLCWIGQTDFMLLGVSEHSGKEWHNYGDTVEKKVIFDF